MIVTIPDYWKHPDYVANTTSTYNHPFHGERTMTNLPLWDIALLALRRSLPSMSHYSRAIPLISPDISFSPDVKFVASGWGLKLNVSVADIQTECQKELALGTKPFRNQT